MRLYSTVAGEGRAEQIIDRSRFIAHVKPVSSKEEGDAFVASIRKSYKDATHNVPAMVIGDKFQIQWASDDGEPQGTSGAPIVQMLVQEGITNLVVVVTRYFGGVKLGTGGLVRAYTGSAKLGIQAAGICDVADKLVLTYRVDYSVFNRLQNHSFAVEAQITDICYTDAVTFDIAAEPEEAAALKEEIAGISGGRAVLEEESVRYEQIPRNI